MYSTSSVSLRLEGTFGVASIGMGNFRSLRMLGVAHRFGELRRSLSGHSEAGSGYGAQRYQNPQSCLLLIHPTSPISFFGAESLQRCLRKHLPQHGHEIPLGESTCTIAQHRHRAGGLGVSEESLDLFE